MNKSVLKKVKGFTLIEMLLVAVIVAMILYAAMAYFQQRALQSRIDRTSAQMQQILNAALAYYVSNGTWPANLACLQGQSPCTVQYLPSNISSPWGGVQYVAGPDNTNNVFYVYVPITFKSASKAPGEIALSIAGNLPLSYVSSQASGAPPSNTACGASATSCTIVSSVNIPGDNLNNARAVNFAGLYRNGGCVPVPKCPVDANGNTMVPQVFVVPVSVSGYFLNSSNPGNTNVYPISSFTAYAKGPPGATPPACQDTSSGANAPGTSCGTLSPSTPQPNQQYWRACLQVVTEPGIVNGSTGTSDWGQNVTVLAITRCAVNQEPAGSTFTVFQ